MPTFDRMDILSAYYLFGMEYSGGQGSREYGYTCRVLNCGWNPGRAFRNRGSLSENAQDIYDALCDKYVARGLAYIGPAKDK